MFCGLETTLFETARVTSSELSQRISSCHTSVLAISGADSVQWISSASEFLKFLSEGANRAKKDFKNLHLLSNDGRFKRFECKWHGHSVKDVKVFPVISESGNSCALLLGGGGSVDSKALDFAEYTRIAMSCAGMLSAKSKGSLRPEGNATVCACGGHGLSRFEPVWAFWSYLKSFLSSGFVLPFQLSSETSTAALANRGSVCTTLIQRHSSIFWGLQSVGNLVGSCRKGMALDAWKIK